MGEETRVCTKCGIEFPATQEFFLRKRVSSEVLRTVCKKCDSEYHRNRNIANGKGVRVGINDLPMEEWRQIDGYSGAYEISDFGRVKRTSPGMSSYPDFLRRQNPNHKGYLCVHLVHGDVNKTRSVHKLVAEAFIGECPEGMFVHHIDSDKTNNNVSNLMYVTPSENLRYSFMSGERSHRGEKHPSNILTENDVHEIRKLLKDGDLTQKEIGKMYGVDRTTIGKIKNKNNWWWLEDE